MTSTNQSNVAKIETNSSSQNKTKKPQGIFDTLPPVTTAAVTVALIMYPVDIVRALVMAQASGQKLGVPELINNFYKTHGLAGFIKQGLGPEMLRATFSRTIKFWLQPIAHIKLFGKKESEGTAFSKGLSGALSTIPEVMVISPFENAKLAQQLDKDKRFNGAKAVFSHLYGSRGIIGGFYVGYFGMQLRQMLWTGGYFLSLDVFRSKSQKLIGKKNVVADTIAGFGAGVFGTILNTWTDVVRTIIQKKAISETFDPKIKKQKLTPTYFISGVTGMIETTLNIYSTRGFTGLYSGFLVKSFYLGGSGALLAVLMPRFKLMWGLSE